MTKAICGAEIFISFSGIMYFNLLENVRFNLNCKIALIVKWKRYIREQLNTFACLQEHAYEKFLIRQCRKVFEENAMLVVFMSFKLSGEDMRLLRNKMACHDIKFKIFSNWIMQ